VHDVCVLVWLSLIPAWTLPFLNVRLARAYQCALEDSQVAARAWILALGDEQDAVEVVTDVVHRHRGMNLVDRAPQRLLRHAERRAVVRAMPRMLVELRQRPELGFVHAEMWLARTTIMVQY
jgi:Domain of unknown function (DUF4188)